MQSIPSTSTKIYKHGIRLLLVVLLGSCLSPVDIPTENIGGRLVVSGQVSSIAEQNYVQIGRTAETDRLPLPVVGAAVQLFDDLPLGQLGNLHLALSNVLRVLGQGHPADGEHGESGDHEGSPAHGDISLHW